MPKLILDVMGGDHAPQAMLEGALQALPELEGELILIGPEETLRPYLSKRRFRALRSHPRCKVSWIHSTESIEMDESIKAVRSKPGASINLGCKLAGESWKEAQAHPEKGPPAAFISAGHSGAMMASALLNMGRLPGVERPAIAAKLPSLSADGTVVLDMGAITECKPEHLRDFAVMGALFAQVERQNPALPRVGVLSNGEERSKGTELTRQAVTLIETHPAFRGDSAIGKFMGYAEGKEIFKGNVDVVVTDGFVGNVVLKASEGLASAIITLLKREAKSSPWSALGFAFASQALRRLKRRMDYAETGAAPLLGVAGYAFICHGRSNGRAIKNALLRAQSAVTSAYLEKMALALSQHERERN